MNCITSIILTSCVTHSQTFSSWWVSMPYFVNLECILISSKSGWHLTTTLARRLVGQLPLPAHVLLSLKTWQLFLMSQLSMSSVFQYTKCFVWVLVAVHMPSINMYRVDEEIKHQISLTSHQRLERPKDNSRASWWNIASPML